MEPRIYHGNITPSDVAIRLMGQFNRGNYRVQQLVGNNEIVVQIATSSNAAAGGETALSISLRNVGDGISVQMGQQTWYGVAASVGYTVFTTLRNPLSLLSRLDDLAQDIENLELTDDVWKVIDATAQIIGAGSELSERLRRIECRYCGTANPVGTGRCLACGAPLGDSQPHTCLRCGFVLKLDDVICPNCKIPV